MPSTVNQRPASKAPSTMSRRVNGARSTAGKQLTATKSAAQKTPPVPHAADGASPYAIMASRIANRVAEMAEGVTFVERPQPREAQSQVNGKKTPRKLEIRLPAQDATGVKFSAPFLDNLLGKMLSLQNQMLVTGRDIAASDVEDDIKKDQFEQAAELSKIIALICAEKARQGTV